MKFEFDHRTGTMQPKKDDQIYFAKSMGGGLIIDDKKNNIKYIIERDERITKLFGSFDKDSLNFYDMRDARMISDRVRRMFGIDHKYTDYHYFLKGYHMNEHCIKTCTEYINESMWSDIQDRNAGDIISKEDGEVIGELPDGTKLIMPREAFSDGDLVDFDGEKWDLLKEDLYIAVLNDGETDTYYMYDEESETPVNMVKCFQADHNLREENDFGVLRALIHQKEWDDDYMHSMSVIYDRNVSGDIYFDIDLGNKSFLIFNDYDRVKEYAVDSMETLVEDDFSSDREEHLKQIVEHYRNQLGDDFFNIDSMEREIKESEESYYDGLSEEEAIDLLLQYNIIEDTEEYFELDENGETDHTMPKFEYIDYEEEFVEKSLDNIDDVVDYFLSNYGYAGVGDYIDFSQLAEMIVDSDGPANSLAGCDGKEREEIIDGTIYYIYRTN